MNPNTDKLNQVLGKNLYFYSNSAIILLGFFAILYFIKKNNKNIRDEDSYDWSKYTIVSDKKINNKRTDLKDKVKQRQKSLSKGNGLIKEEHRFPVINPVFDNKKENFLNLEEANNLQDMINFAASVNLTENKNGENINVETAHVENVNVQQEQNVNLNANEKLDILFKETLKNTELDKESKIKKILELFKQLIKLKNKKLNEITYSALVEFFIINAHFDHASYFLCQMDKHKINIPRTLLDLFLEYSIQHKIFEKSEKYRLNNRKDDDETKNKKQDFHPFYNKYDQYDPQNDPDYAYYFSKKNVSKQRGDIGKLFSNLKIDSKPFFPKNLENKNSISDIDPKNIKEFIPKGYKIEKKEENKQ